MSTEAALKAKWEKYYAELPTVFWQRVDNSSGPDNCWPYLGAKRSNGYGRLRVRGRYELAHRMAYKFKFGVEPGRLVVMHKCDNPPCCNPRHLVLGTHSDNMADKTAKGRQTMHRAKLTRAQVSEILARLQDGDLGSTLANQYGVSQTAISRIKVGRTWAALRARGEG